MGKLAGDQTDSIDSRFLSLMAVGVITIHFQHAFRAIGSSVVNILCSLEPTLSVTCYSLLLRKTLFVEMHREECHHRHGQWKIPAALRKYVHLASIGLINTISFSKILKVVYLFYQNKKHPYCMKQSCLFSWGFIVVFPAENQPNRAMQRFPILYHQHSCQ